MAPPDAAPDDERLASAEAGRLSAEAEADALRAELRVLQRRAARGAGLGGGGVAGLEATALQERLAAEEMRTRHAEARGKVFEEWATQARTSELAAQRAAAQSEAVAAVAARSQDQARDVEGPAGAEVVALQARLGAMEEAASMQDASNQALRAQLAAEESGRVQQANQWAEEWDELSRQLDGAREAGGARADHAAECAALRQEAALAEGRAGSEAAEAASLNLALEQAALASVEQMHRLVDVENERDSLARRLAHSEARLVTQTGELQDAMSQIQVCDMALQALRRDAEDLREELVPSSVMSLERPQDNANAASALAFSFPSLMGGDAPPRPHCTSPSAPDVGFVAAAGHVDEPDALAAEVASLAAEVASVTTQPFQAVQRSASPPAQAPSWQASKRSERGSPVRSRLSGTAGEAGEAATTAESLAMRFASLAAEVQSLAPESDAGGSQSGRRLPPRQTSTGGLGGNAGAPHRPLTSGTGNYMVFGDPRSDEYETNPSECSRRVLPDDYGPGGHPGGAPDAEAIGSYVLLPDDIAPSASDPGPGGEPEYASACARDAEQDFDSQAGDISMPPDTSDTDRYNIAAESTPPPDTSDTDRYNILMGGGDDPLEEPIVPLRAQPRSPLEVRPDPRKARSARTPLADTGSARRGPRQGVAGQPQRSRSVDRGRPSLMMAAARTATPKKAAIQGRVRAAPSSVAIAPPPPGATLVTRSTQPVPKARIRARSPEPVLAAAPAAAPKVAVALAQAPVARGRAPQMTVVRFPRTARSLPPAEDRARDSAPGGPGF